MRTYSLIIGIIFLFYCCNSDNKTVNKNLVGRWEVVYLSETTGSELPKGVWIEFFDDGSFISNSGTGIWNIEANKSVLLLEGDEDVQDISEWKIKIAGYSMSWVGTKNYTDTENIELKLVKLN